MDYYHGTLQCSWKNGFPHYVFTVDDKRKVFISTNIKKIEPCSDKGVEYIYTFYSKELNLLGEMNVSTTFEFCPYGAQIMKTQFVLYANGDNNEGYTHTLEQARKKNRRLSKFANILKSRSYKKSFSALQERLLEPKLELAAIVVKNHVSENEKEVDIGGWGLKFLRKARHSESCIENASHCSTSMNVLVPAGVHGGPKTKNIGGPSSLVERWRSGGSCDCGGWDLGCPLTVLRAKPNNQDSIFGGSFSFDLFIQGHKQSEPALKMVNVRDGLYNLRYKSILLPLQSLSIVVAAIHNSSPILRPGSYEN